MSTRSAIALSVIVCAGWLGAARAHAQLPGLGSLVVNVTSPASGSIVAGTISMSASVTVLGGLTVRGVRFRIDGVNVGPEDTTPPYSVPWNTATATNASHSVTAVARDALGVLWTSPPVTVTVDNIPPTVSINQATGQADPTNASPIGFRVVFSEPVSGFTAADVGIGGTAGGSKTVAVSGGPSAYNLSVSGMTSGTLVATIAAAGARDAAGNGNTASTSTDNSVTFDTAPPTVTINQDAGQADPTRATPVNFRAVFSEPVVGFTAADVAIGGTAGGARTVSVAGGPAIYTVGVSGVTDGTLTATIAAGTTRDAAGNNSAGSTSTDNQVRFDATAPTVAVTSPTGGTVSGAVQIAANASDASGVVGVRFAIDGVPSGTEDTSAPYAINWQTTGAADGAHALTAIARDAAGNTATSAPVTVTVANNNNDTVPPTVAITAPGGGASVAGTITVTANATDNRGVVSIAIRLDGQPLGPEGGQAPHSVQWDTTTAANGSHTLTAEARDASGNVGTSPAIAVTVANTAPPPPPATGATRFEHTEPSVTYADGWFQGSRSRAWSGGTAAVSRIAGARATFTFSGTSVSWIGFRGPWTGMGRIFLDGAFVQEVDTYAPTEQVRAVIFSATNLAPGNHVLAIEPTGQMNPSATDNSLWVDAFDVAPGVPLPALGTRADEASPSVVYSGAWTQGDRSHNWSGSTAAVTTTAGARATFTFRGTTVSWIGLRGPQNGIARIILDGSFAGEVDTFLATEVQAVVFSVAGLAPGTHTLAIEATGDKNGASSGTSIVVDAFDVRSRFEEADPAVAFVGSWGHGNTNRAWSGTSEHTGTGMASLTSAAGSRATFTFRGTSVSWISFRGPQAGIAQVSIDGGPVQEVDLFAPVEQVQAVAFTAAGLADATHTIRIDATGRANPAAVGGLVTVDAFDVTLPVSAPQVARVQETTASAVYTAGWSPNGSTIWSGGTAAVAGTSGERVTFTFTGSGVRWISYRAKSTGIARVSIDGVFVGEVDLYSDSEQFHSPVFAAGGLSPGSHTLTIEATGLKNALAENTLVVIDAFDVIP